MRGRKSIFWGVVLLLAAAALLLGRLGYLEGVGFWTILFSAILISFLVKGIVRLRIGTILFSLAFLVIVNDELLYLEAITPWPVLGAALLGTIGLKILFPRLGKYRGGHLVRIGSGDNMVRDYSQGGECVSYDNVFGESTKYVWGTVSQVDVDNVFGSIQVYLTEAVLDGGTASVNVDTVFGSTTIYVPQTWRVELNTENVFGFAEQTGKYNFDGENVLHVGGDVVFGSLEVISV